MYICTTEPLLEVLFFLYLFQYLDVQSYESFMFLRLRLLESFYIVQRLVLLVTASQNVKELSDNAL